MTAMILDGVAIAEQLRAEVATGDRPLGVVGRDRPWKRGRGRPGGYCRHRRDEFCSDVTTVLTKAQERSHGGDDALQAGWPQVSGLAANEIDDVARNHRAQIDWAIAEPRLEELPRCNRVPLDRR